MPLALFYLTHCRPIDFSINVRSGYSIVYIESRVIISNTISHFFLWRSILSLDHIEESDLMLCSVIFYLGIFTIRKNTNIRVSSLQMVKYIVLIKLTKRSIVSN